MFRILPQVKTTLFYSYYLGLLTTSNCTLNGYKDQNSHICIVISRVLLRGPTYDKYNIDSIL